MQEFKGKVAFITGGASGIGLGMAEAFGSEGMSVMIADIESKALEHALELLRSNGIRAEGVVCDVASRDSVNAAANETIAKFGKVHLVCNNAGIGAGGPIGSIPHGDWNWIIDVNLLGVVYGVEIFTPLIESHDEGGWIINTASIAGMLSLGGMEPYSATKFAVVAMSEGWAQQLAMRNIGMSVLCPGFVRTQILDARRNRQTAYGAEEAVPQQRLGMVSDEMITSGMDPAVVGRRVLEAVKGKEFYIFTHPEFKTLVQNRFNGILEAFKKAESSDALSALPKRPVPGRPS